MNPSSPATTTLSAEDVLPHVGQRLDVFLAAALQRSRSHVQTLLKQGLVEVQPAPPKMSPSYHLKKGDSVTIQAAPVMATEPELSGEAIPLDILFEDEALIALNKQPGLVVHPAAGHWSGTLVNALVHHSGPKLAQRGGPERLGIVHRLDKDTSGVMLIAKTDEAHERLSKSFADRAVKKLYRALCWGVFRRPNGECRGPIGRHPQQRKKMAVLKNVGRGRTAWTDYHVLQQGKAGAEVECALHTGRTHQIRVHLSHMGHPIWGDLLYGHKHPLSDGFCPQRQMLHAAHLEIAHPMTGNPLIFDAPLPEDYLAARKRLMGT